MKRRIRIPIHPSLLVHLPAASAEAIARAGRLIQRVLLARGEAQRQMFLAHIRAGGLSARIPMGSITPIGHSQPGRLVPLEELLEGAPGLAPGTNRVLAEETTPLLLHIAEHLSRRSSHSWQPVGVAGGILFVAPRTASDPDQWALPRFAGAQNNEEEQQCVDANRQGLTAWTRVAPSCDLKSRLHDQRPADGLAAVRSRIRDHRQRLFPGARPWPHGGVGQIEETIPDNIECDLVPLEEDPDPTA